MKIPKIKIIEITVLNERAHNKTLKSSEAAGPPRVPLQPRALPGPAAPPGGRCAAEAAAAGAGSALGQKSPKCKISRYLGHKMHRICKMQDLRNIHIVHKIHRIHEIRSIHSTHRITQISQITQNIPYKPLRTHTELVPHHQSTLAQPPGFPPVPWLKSMPSSPPGWYKKRRFLLGPTAFQSYLVSGLLPTEF